MKLKSINSTPLALFIWNSSKTKQPFNIFISIKKKLKSYLPGHSSRHSSSATDVSFNVVFPAPQGMQLKAPVDGW